MEEQIEMKKGFFTDRLEKNLLNPPVKSYRALFMQLKFKLRVLFNSSKRCSTENKNPEQKTIYYEFTVTFVFFPTNFSWRMKKYSFNDLS